MVLHADHGQCASATTVRTAGSSGRISSPAWRPVWRRCGGPDARWRQRRPVCKCWGILQASNRSRRFISKVKGSLAFRRLGFGNSRYKYLDPQAAILRRKPPPPGAGRAGHVGPAASGGNGSGRRWRSTIPTLWRMDFRRASVSYTAVIQKRWGLPSSMFVVMTAVQDVRWGGSRTGMKNARVAAECYRPRQIYTGQAARDYVSRRGIK